MMTSIISICVLFCGISNKFGQ